MDAKNDEKVLQAGILDKFRFAQDLQKQKGTGCLLYTRRVGPLGYARFYVNGVSVSAHRVAKLWDDGVAHLDREAAHLCRNRNCVNPKHVYWATSKQNAHDKVRDGTNYSAFGEAHGHSKLTDDDVKAIWDLLRIYPKGCTRIGRQFGVCATTILNIRKGLIWRAVTSTLEPLPVEVKRIYPTIHRAKWTKFSEQETAIVCQMLDDGVPLRTVARHANSSGQAIMRLYLHNRGQVHPRAHWQRMDLHRLPQ